MRSSKEIINLLAVTLLKKGATLNLPEKNIKNIRSGISKK